MDKPDQMTVAQLKTILDRYPDNELVTLYSYSGSHSNSFFYVGEETIMEQQEQ